MGAKKYLVAAAASVALSAAAVTGTPQDASAALNCNTGFTAQGYAFGNCITGEPGGNNYRVNVLCQNRITLASRVVHGNTVNVNDTVPSTITGCGNWLEHYYGQPWTQTMWQQSAFSIQSSRGSPSSSGTGNFPFNSLYTILYAMNNKQSPASKKSSTLPVTIGAMAALMGVASGFLYEYHNAVKLFRPDDVSDVLGLYLWLGSIVLWVVFLVVFFITNKRQP